MVKTIGPLWNRRNLDNINENFNILNKDLTNIPDLVKGASVLKEKVDGTVIKVEALEDRFRFYVDIDLNDCISAGLYYIGSGNNKNMPAGKANGMLKVTSSRTSQIVHQEYTNSNIAEQTFVRRLRDGNWSEWVETTVTKTRLDELENLIKDASSVLANSVLMNPELIDGTSYWSINAGNPTVVADQGTSILIVEADRSHQLSQMVSWKKDHIYYMQVDVNVTNYVSGRMGIQANGRFVNGNTINLSVSRDTAGWETLYTNFSAIEDYKLGVYYGSMDSAKLSGRAKNAYIVDLTEMYGEGKEPSAEDFSDLKLSMKNDGIKINSAEVFNILVEKIDSLVKDVPVSSTDVQAEQVFIDEMNNKCLLWRMQDTVFKNAHGLSTTGQVSSARDMLRLTLQAAGAERMLKVWGAKEYNVNVKGEKPRMVNILSTVTNPMLEATYLLLGGKSGTLGSTVNNASVLSQVKDGTYTFASVVMTSSTNISRYEDTKKLIDVIIKKLANPNYVPTEKFTAVSAAGILIPNNPLNLTNLEMLPNYGYYGFNESASLQQASLTKMMTVLIMIENVSNWYETFTIKSSDLVGGSGPAMFVGDKISFMDALYLMMLPSSNITAKAISRVIGHKIIKSRGYV